MSRGYELFVGALDANQRLDRYLVSRLPDTYSRSAIQRAIDHGAVTVGGSLAKAHRRLKAGDRVAVAADQLEATSAPSTWEPEDMPLDVIHEDADLLVINKPPGLVTHPAPGHWSGTLVNAVLWHLKRSSEAQVLPNSEFRIPKLPRAGIVHRLDKDTSGLLVVAKTDIALRVLSAQLKSRTLGRTYVAVVEGHLPFDQGTVDAAIGRHAKHRKEMAVRHLGGRAAVTRYQVLARREVGLPAAGRPGQTLRLRYSVVEVALQTGRTHQIRVHLAHLGHPLLGDATYGNHPPAFWASWGIRRQLLHAWKLRLTHPSTGQRMDFHTQVPQDMTYFTEG